MENLEIQVKQELGTITTNFSDIEKELRLQMSAYESFVVSEDEIPMAKGDLAFLRKLRTSIDDKRKEVKRAYMKPYEGFEESCKKLMGIIDEPIGVIDSQLKLFETDRVEKKHKRVMKLYEEQVGELIRFLPVEKNYNPKWDNKSTTDQDISFDISAMVLKVKNDLSVIESLNSEIKDELLATYEKSGNDLAKAVERNSQYLSHKAKVVEKVKEAEKHAPIEEKKVEEPTPIKQMDDLAQMIKTAKIIVSLNDLAQIKETLDFMGIKYQVEGE